MRTLFALILLCPALLMAESYWQQDVSYKIDATLRTKDNTIAGVERLVYRNNSPDVLNAVYFRLYWNLFTEGSRGQKYAETQKQFYRGTSGGISILKFAVLLNGVEKSPEYTIDNTLMRVILPSPLNPGESITFHLEFEGKIPEEGDRTGHEGRDYDIAQWYPQISTYDKHGWDKSQYLGPAEFHLEYGTFDVNITLPKSFTLGYTGVLVNPEEVYPDSVLRRLKQSEADTGTVRIADYSKKEWGAVDTVMTTWKFHADNVRDFAFSANENYIWDATGLLPRAGETPVTIHALYFPDKEEFWKDAARHGAHAVQFFSEHFGSYAYRNVFIVEGPVGGGMEYPGITFIGHYGEDESNSLFGIITHEVAHNWFPMMVGSNETSYPFMDEGFATYMTVAATEDYFGRYNNEYIWTKWYQKLLHFPNDAGRESIQRESFRIAKTGYEEPVTTHPYRNRHSALSGSSYYSKTGAVLYMLQYVLGDSLFENGMKDYFSRWKFKHPYPEDFFAAMETSGGRRDLSWFFDEWFNKTVTCDYGISGFDARLLPTPGQPVYQAKLSVRRYNPAIMPVDVRIDMADGSRQMVYFPIDRWLNAETEQDTILELKSEPLRAELNPDGRILDINRLNNRSGSPKIIARLDNTMFNIPPVDAYLLKWRPSFWYTDQGGWNVGYKISGSYLEDLYGANLWQAYNTRDNTLDYALNLSHNTYSLTPLSRAQLGLYRMEGRKGASVSLQKELRRRYGISPYHTFRLTFSYSRSDNSEYLLHRETWEEGALERALFGYYYYNRGRFWNVNASAVFEGSTTFLGRGDFQYSKRTFQVKGRLNMPGGWDLALRFYNGIGYGDIPEQTKYYFSGSSPIDQMEEPFFRSKGPLPSTLRDHAMSEGGGNMRGYYGILARGEKIDAINAEARFSKLIPFVNLNLPLLSYLMHRVYSSVFFDAGRIAQSGEALLNRRFEVDFGFGFRLASLSTIFGSFSQSDILNSLGLYTLRVDFPVYVSMPKADENKLKLRWVLSLSEVL